MESGGAVEEAAMDGVEAIFQGGDGLDGDAGEGGTAAARQDGDGGNGSGSRRGGCRGLAAAGRRGWTGGAETGRMAGMKASRWLWMAAGWAAAAMAAAGGTALDAASLEREVRGEVLAFGVASGRERAVAGRLAEMDTEMLAKVAVLALGARVEGWREVFAELGRREMPAAERYRVTWKLVEERLEASFKGKGDADDLRALMEEWGRALWADWEAGRVPEEERWRVGDELEMFCYLMESDSDLSEEEREVWEARKEGIDESEKPWREAQNESWKAKMEARREEASAERVRRTAEAEREGKEKGEAWRRLRRGVELRELGRTKDASAEWRRAAEVAEEAGDAELAWEARALLAGRGDWTWRRGEQWKMCEEEIAAGSPWGEYLRTVEVSLAQDAGRFDEALDLALEGWLDYGSWDWGRLVGDAAAMRGGVDAELCQVVAGMVLDEVPAEEEHREYVKLLVVLRWALGELYPGRAERTLEGDLERVAARSAAVKSEKRKVKSEDTEAEREAAGGSVEEKTLEVSYGEIPSPGQRWEGTERSWMTDEAFPEIERELNEILLAEGDEKRVEAWRAKWSPEERRGLRVNGAGGEFAALAASFLNLGSWWGDWKERGKSVLEEAKAQEGYDGERLFGVLAAMVERGIMREGEADATEVTEWVDWARRVAAGDPVLEARAALLEARRAVWLGDEAALRRVAVGNLEGIVRWGTFGSGGGGTWPLLAKGGDERRAAEVALAAVKMAPGLGFAGDAMAMMDVMTAAELEAFRDALWMKAMTDPWGTGAWWERLARGAVAISGGGWNDVEAHLRLARLEEQGVECGDEGMALAERLGEGSARAVAVGLKGRLAGFGGPISEEKEAEGGRWAEWCAGVRRVARTGYGEEGRYVLLECDLAEVLPPWLDRMVQRRLREALADWGGATTEEEREAVGGALESLGTMAGATVYGGKAATELLEDWRLAAAEAGEWAAEALDRGWTAGEKKREEEARTETRVIELMSRSELTEEEEEEVGQLTDW